MMKKKSMISESGNDGEEFIEDSENLSSKNRKIEKEKINRRSESEEGSSSRLVTELLPPKWPRTRSVREDENAYQKLKSLLSSITANGAILITAIHQCTRTGPMEKARVEVFQESLEKVTRARGNRRVHQAAWYGTSAKNVDSIMRCGFEMDRIVPGSYPYGVGIYLSPFVSPQISDMMSDINENGEKHIILCQVILGNFEKVELGSKQIFRSSGDFDTGIDDLTNPKLYVVWCGNMNTHILPCFIVSYKLIDRHMLGRRLITDDAHSDNTWSRLLIKLHNFLTISKRLELRNLCISYGEGTIVDGKFFMRQLQSIVRDDQLLRSIMLEISPKLKFF